MKKRTAILVVALTAVGTVGLMGGLAVAAGPGGDAAGMAPGTMLAHFRDGHDRHARMHARFDRGRGGPGMMRHLCSPRRDAFLAAGIAYVQASLEFTPEQTAAWDNLTTKLQEGSQKVGENCSARAAEPRPTTSIDRLAGMERGLTNALAIVQDIRPAYDAFYATLTAEQQKTLEDLLPHRGFRRHGGFGGERQDQGSEG